MCQSIGACHGAVSGTTTQAVDAILSQQIIIRGSFANDSFNWEVRRKSRLLAGSANGMCTNSLMWTSCFSAFGVFVFVMTKRFMRDNFRAYYKIRPDLNEQDLPWREYLNFIPYWDIISVIADTLVLDGSFWLQYHDEQNYNAEQLDKHAVVLGIGALLVWCSLLQYLNVHYKFGILFKTIRRAFVNVMAFLACAAVIFLGYLVCGYVVLGPYHIKFQKFSSASETLIAIINGDEMYSTFHMLNERQESNSKTLIWFFTRFYLFSIIAIFMFVVINLIMAIILGAYEAIKQHYEEEENLRDIAPLEKALYRFVEKSKTGVFRNSIFQLLKTRLTTAGKRLCCARSF